MLAIIPAAGKGKRLRPLTNIAPKPLLPVYNKPMIFYSLLSLKEAGIKEVIIVVDKKNKDYFKNFFKDGKKFGLKIHYVIQKEQKGIAHSIASAKRLAKNKKIIVIHADNIFELLVPFAGYGPFAVTIAKYNPNKPEIVELLPNKYYVMRTIERVNCLENSVGKIVSRSTLYRSGIILITGLLDPG